MQLPSIGRGSGSPEFANAIATACIQKWKSLPRKGKPESHQWTVLAGIVLVVQNRDSIELQVASLGSGTKAVGSPDYPSNGEIVLDCHAEVLARRAFQLYHVLVHINLHSRFLLKQIAADGGKYLVQQGKRWRLVEGVSVHMYVSQAPCT